MQNPEDLVRATQEEQDGGAIAGETGPLEDLDALSKELGDAAPAAGTSSVTADSDGASSRCSSRTSWRWSASS